MPERLRSLRIDAREIDRIFAGVNRSDAPGATVGIAVAGRPVYRRGFGLASLELPVVLSPSIRMRIASVTKHFTCLAYLLLCEDGRATPDDTIGLHLPELNPAVHALTMRQLMGHISGLRDVNDICHTFTGTGRAITATQMLAMYRTIDDLNAAPGTAWSYNNGGYVILSAVIERLAGRSLDDVFRERIFEPAGLHDTVLHRWDSDFLPNLATQHMTRAGGRFDRSYIGNEDTGEGGVVSTVDDMLRWLAQLDAPVVGTAQTWAMMTTPMVLLNGTPTGYGCGLRASEYRGVKTLGHTGGLMGSNSYMLKAPDVGLDIVVLVNRHDVSAVALGHQIFDVCMDLPPLVDIAPTTVPATGVFRSARTGRVIALTNKDGRQHAMIDGTDNTLSAHPSGELRHVGPRATLDQFITLAGDRQTPDAITFHDLGTADTLDRVPSPQPADDAALVGTYRCAAAGVEASIATDGAGLRLETRMCFGNAVYALEPLARRIWRVRSSGMMPWGGVLTLGKGGDVSFSSARTAALPFRRVS